MGDLKSSTVLLFFCLLTSGCQSGKAFSLKTFSGADRDKTSDLHVIQVNSDRVRQKCLFLDAEAENNWRHQYLIYILGDKNEVLEIMQPTHLDKDSCDTQLQKIEKILRSESMVKICGRDELRQTDQSDEESAELILFGKLGTHKIVYESLTLDSICNARECFSNNSVWVNTCPGFVKY